MPRPRHGTIAWASIGNWSCHGSRDDFVDDVAPPQNYRANANQRDQYGISRRPRPALPLKAKNRLDDRRIGKQRQNAPQVAGAVKKIGIRRIAMTGVGKLSLQQRRVGGHGKERQTN